MILLMSGCEEQTDQRLLEMAQRYSQRQAQQSQQMLELQQEVASGSRKLVEADARAREELVAQQSGVNQQRDQLEQERQAIAAQRYRDPLIAAVMTHFGLIVICLLPLLICWQLLRQPIEPASEQELTEILIQDLLAKEPLFALRHDRPRRLENAEQKQSASTSASHTPSSHTDQEPDPSDS